MASLHFRLSSVLGDISTKYSGDEAVAAPGNIDNEPISVLPVAQHATQCRDMDCQIGRLDKNIGPHASHQFLLTDQLTWTFQQDNQDFQSTTSERHRPLVFQQQELCRKQPKRSE